MGKLIITILLVLCLVNCLSLLGLLGFGAVTGRLGAEQRAQYLATWRGEKLIPEPEDTGEVEAAEAPQEAGARIAALEETREINAREVQRDIQLLRTQQGTLAMERDKLEQDAAELHAKETEFNQKVEEYNQMVQQEGFRKALKNYSQMKPKLVKEDFMKMSDAEVVRYVFEMKSDVATRVLEQFKTPEEAQKRLAIIQLLETQKVVMLNANGRGNIK